MRPVFLINFGDPKSLLLNEFLKYLKGTVKSGICFSSNVHESSLKCYSDSDFAADSETRRSVSGMVMTYAGGAITWASKKQQSVSLSTTEAEFVAASEAAKEIVWLTRLFNEITELGEIPILQVDNQSAIKLIKNPEFHKRTKHIDVRYYFVRELYEEGKIGVEYVATQEQLADIMTKPLAKGPFQELRGKLGFK